MRPSILVRIVVAAVLAAIVHSPARAGSYQLNGSVTTGQTTVTCNGPASPSYPGGSWATGGSGASASVVNGSATVHSAVTWSWTWVPDEGQDITSDPPFEQGWEVDYTLYSYGSYSSSAGNPATNHDTITVSGPDDSATLSDDGTGVPTVYSYDCSGQMIPISQWNYQDPVSGTPNVSIVTLLNGANPTLTINIDGSCFSSGLEISAGVMATAPDPFTGPETIIHSYPVVDGVYAPNNPLHPKGRWRGNRRQPYQLNFKAELPLNNPTRTATAGGTGSAADQQWTWSAGVLDIPGGWFLTAQLMARDGAGRYNNSRATDTLSFTVTNGNGGLVSQ